MSQLDIQSNLVCAFLEGAGNTHITNLPFLDILVKSGSVKYNPKSDGVKNTLTMSNNPVVATDSDGTGMAVHDAGLNYSYSYLSYYPVKRVISRDLMHTKNNKYANIDALQAVMDTTIQELFTGIHSDLLNNTTNPKGIQGLLLGASDTPDVTAYQGLDPAKYPIWKNQFYDGKNTKISNSAFDGTAATEDNILKRISYMINKSTIRRSSFGTYALCGEGIYNLIQGALSKSTSLNIQSGQSININIQEPQYNGIKFVNAGGITDPKYAVFPSMTMVIFSPENFTLYYDNPFKRGYGLQSLVRLSANLNNPKIQITKSEHIQSLAYIDVEIGTDRATFHKTPDLFSQWTHISSDMLLMCRDRRQLIRYSEA